MRINDRNFSFGCTTKTKIPIVYSHSYSVKYYFNYFYTIIIFLNKSIQ